MVVTFPSRRIGYFFSVEDDGGEGSNDVLVEYWFLSQEAAIFARIFDAHVGCSSVARALVASVELLRDVLRCTFGVV